MSEAERILNEAYVIDGHLDVGLILEYKYEKGIKNVLMDEYLDSLREGHVDCIVAALYADSKWLPDHGVRQIMEQISRIYEEVEASEGNFVIVRNTEEMLKAKENGQIAILFMIEGAEAIEGRISILTALYELGLRIISPCWSRTTWAADGARFMPIGGYVGTGLTDEGKELVRYCEKKGIIIDVSHCNLKSFWDIANMSTRPFIATHSNSYAVSPVDRNLEDDQIKAIADKGGVMGLNGASLIVDFENPDKADVAKLVDHLMHEREVAGIGCISIGLDQSETLNDTMGDLIDTAVFDIIPEHRRLPELVEEMLNRGLSEDEIKAVLGGNLLRVFRETID